MKLQVKQKNVYTYSTNITVEKMYHREPNMRTFQKIMENRSGGI